MKKFILPILLIFIANFGFSQTKDIKDRSVRVNGVLVTVDSLELVSFARIMDKTTEHGTTSDFYGYFSLLAKPGDTLLFDAFGFKSGSYILSDTLTGDSYSLIHFMLPDVQEYPEIDVYPWPTKEEFDKMFLELNPFDGNLRALRNQLSSDEMVRAARNYPLRRDLDYNWENQQRESIIYPNAMTPPNNLLNPLAWAKFVDEWKKGYLKRK
ncbi:MAG: hypothetical protein JJT77_11980 [Crocinitomicaceae bacterium]|nr:hypothetical protein [Crocinitomicaceae bacterium]